MSYDSDAQSYMTAVETADGQTLPYTIRDAINNFVVGCKSDGNWTAISASCLLAGPATLNGVLVPLKGPAPTNVNFVTADYSQFTGLKGNGTTKYLDSNRNNNADPQNRHHLAVYVTEAGSITVNNYALIGTGGSATGESVIGYANSVGGLYFLRSRSAAAVDGSLVSQQTGFHGVSRFSSTELAVRVPGHSSVTPITLASETPRNQNIWVFGRDIGTPYMNGRMSFYSIGSDLTSLSALRTRIETYMTEIVRPIVSRRRRQQGAYGL